MQDLPFQTPTQFIALALTLLAGWLLGLASASGGRKWKTRYKDAEASHAAYRRERETELERSNSRISELEAERDRLIRDLERERGSSSVTPAAAAAATATTHSDTDREAGHGGWFGWGRDNLSRIRGIDEVRETRLNELGIKTYREIERMTAADEAALEQRLGLEQGEIAREDWREQAALLRAGNDEGHRRRFG